MKIYDNNCTTNSIKQWNQFFLNIKMDNCWHVFTETFNILSVVYDRCFISSIYNRCLFEKLFSLYWHRNAIHKHTRYHVCNTYVPSSCANWLSTSTKNTNRTRHLFTYFDPSYNKLPVNDTCHFAILTL